jgi:DNA-binding MurR/RpiR family transcriptional regulator
MPSLRPAEQRVGEAVLADPAAISESSITTVARQCMTSETTVLRFCRAIGLGGYPELRIALARAAQREETDQSARPPVNGTIGENDSVADVVDKISYADSRSVEETSEGAAKTPFLKWGDRVRLEMMDSQGQSLFGGIDHKMARPS